MHAEHPGLKIVRYFSAPQEMVFNLWTDSHHWTNWWGPKDFTNSVCKLDVRPGGKIEVVMRSPTGDERPMGGEFRQIERPKRLRFTTIVAKGDTVLLETLVTVLLDRAHDQTRMEVDVEVVQSTPEMAPALAGMEQGWHQSINRFANWLAMNLTHHGKICYMEVPSTNPQRSADFYAAMFGWKLRKRGDGVIAFDDAVGGVSGAFVNKNRPPSTTPGLLTYVMLNSVAEVLEKVVPNGGRIVQPIGGDHPEITARIADPDGNVIGLYQQPNS